MKRVLFGLLLLLSFGALVLGCGKSGDTESKDPPSGAKAEGKGLEAKKLPGE